MSESRQEKSTHLIGMVIAFLLIAAVSSILSSVLDIQSAGPSQSVAHPRQFPQLVDPNQF